MYVLFSQINLKHLLFLSVSFSLFGVCLMASYQAQYILSEFSTPSVRSNHNSGLTRDNSSTNSNITPNGIRCVRQSNLVDFPLVI